MKNKTSFFLVVALVSLFTGCKEDSSVDIDGPDKPFFYVKYHADHWATVDFDKTCTMTITDENGRDVSYTIGSRNVIIGPVYAGFTAKMTVSTPYDGGNNGSIVFHEIQTILLLMSMHLLPTLTRLKL